MLGSVVPMAHNKVITEIRNPAISTLAGADRTFVIFVGFAAPGAGHAGIRGHKTVVLVGVFASEMEFEIPLVDIAPGTHWAEPPDRCNPRRRRSCLWGQALWNNVVDCCQSLGVV